MRKLLSVITLALAATFVSVGSRAEAQTSIDMAAPNNIETPLSRRSLQYAFRIFGAWDADADAPAVNHGEQPALEGSGDGLLR